MLITDALEFIKARPDSLRAFRLFHSKYAHFSGHSKSFLLNAINSFFSFLFKTFTSEIKIIENMIHDGND